MFLFKINLKINSSFTRHLFFELEINTKKGTFLTEIKIFHLLMLSFYNYQYLIYLIYYTY